MRLLALMIASAVFVLPPAFAGPLVAPGDLALRHDIQRLADHGVLSGPVTTWPLSWGPILSDLQNYRSTERWFAATVLMLSYR